MSADQRVLAWCRQVLGRCSVIGRHTPADSSNTVIRLRGGNGHSYIAKQHADRVKHDREVHAHVHWAPALGEQAARLVATDQALRVVLVTALPGRPHNPTGNPDIDGPIHQQAGALLRRLHSAEPATPLPDFARGMRTRLTSWLERSAGLLTSEEQALVRRHVDALAELPTPEGVPCHLDYQPRNWLIDPIAGLGVVDFEHARVDATVRDLVRLTFRHWRMQPVLRDAFFDGYGRRLDDVEDRVLTHCAALDAVTAIARAHVTNDSVLGVHGRTTLAELPRRL
ncbi:MAG: aminoglycoside phosphotransferase family protein [Actinomycetota bacterium]|nr:aminoglycoside phosphotransferase family protein [Actinomycetota bacterium]